MVVMNGVLGPVPLCHWPLFDQGRGGVLVLVVTCNSKRGEAEDLT